MARRILDIDQKALEINLDKSIYGTFAEIGAGQEVARHFFQVGAAAGTIAKTVSAYDKIVSDKIYGVEGSNRYVCEARLYKMLEHEYDLLVERLRDGDPTRKLFAFADTVSAINYHRTIKGHGWLGLRFQLNPENPPNDLILHVRMLDGDNLQQQQAIGILGVNMLYACFHHHDEPEYLLKSLMHALRGRVLIDMVRLTGPEFKHVDNRLLCLWAVKNELTPVAIFGRDGLSQHASEFLYKKSIMIARGSYRPPTLVQQDMTLNGFSQFKETPVEDERGAWYLTEITLSNLRTDGEINERDYLDRVEVLTAVGQTVMISSCLKHKKLISYFSDYKVRRIGLILGSIKLENILCETYKENQNNVLTAFGEMFLKNVTFYVYPSIVDGKKSLIKARDIKTPKEIKFLYEYLLDSKNVVDVKKFKEENLRIFHRDVLEKIQEGDTDWENDVPVEVADVIKSKKLFGYREREIVKVYGG